jgi:multimeric flavodoxin WrbA
MNILILSGSKNRAGKTASAIEAIHKGITKAGGVTESIFLTELNLEKCRQCNKDGWGICRSEHRCIIEDDFAAISEKIKASDVVVFATPVYFGDLSESMRPSVYATRVGAATARYPALLTWRKSCKRAASTSSI